MRLVVTEFMTLDGVMEAPGFEEHRDGRNGWAMQVADEELQNHNREQAFSTEAFLFGRTTYNIWAAFWPTGPEAGGLKDLIDRTPKYVISKTLEKADWSNTTILRGDPGEEIARLKAQPGGDLVAYGSADLIDFLLARDLIDELRVILFPVILGSGKHLFRDGILARFDAPTRALRCALALCAATRRMGIEIRAAMHTGEVEIRRDDLGGIGVHIAARALAEAGPGDVVVTRTVRDLVTGTDVEFR